MTRFETSGLCSNGNFIKQRDHMKIYYNSFVETQHCISWRKYQEPATKLVSFCDFCEIRVLVVINYAKFVQVVITCLTKMSCNLFTLTANLDKIIMIWLIFIINIYNQNTLISKVHTSKVHNFKKKCIPQKCLTSSKSAYLKSA